MNETKIISGQETYLKRITKGNSLNITENKRRNLGTVGKIKAQHKQKHE